MLDDFVNPTPHIQQALVAESARRAEIRALRHEARVSERLRDVVGRRLIDLGERMIVRDEPGLSPMDTAA